MDENFYSDIKLIFLKISGRAAALRPSAPYERAARVYFASVAQLCFTKR